MTFEHKNPSGSQEKKLSPETLAEIKRLELQLTLEKCNNLNEFFAAIAALPNLTWEARRRQGKIENVPTQQILNGIRANPEHFENGNKEPFFYGGENGENDIRLTYPTTPLDIIGARESLLDEETRRERITALQKQIDQLKYNYPPKPTQSAAQQPASKTTSTSTRGSSTIPDPEEHSSSSRRTSSFSQTPPPDASKKSSTNEALKTPKSNDTGISEPKRSPEVFDEIRLLQLQLTLERCNNLEEFVTAILALPISSWKARQGLGKIRNVATRQIVSGIKDKPKLFMSADDEPFFYGGENDVDGYRLLFPTEPLDLIGARSSLLNKNVQKQRIAALEQRIDFLKKGEAALATKTTTQQPASQANPKATDASPAPITVRPEQKKQITPLAEKPLPVAAVKDTPAIPQPQAENKQPTPALEKKPDEQTLRHEVGDLELQLRLEMCENIQQMITAIENLPFSTWVARESGTNTLRQVSTRYIVKELKGIPTNHIFNDGSGFKEGGFFSSTQFKAFFPKRPLDLAGALISLNDKQAKEKRVSVIKERLHYLKMQYDPETQKQELERLEAAKRQKEKEAQEAKEKSEREASEAARQKALHAKEQAYRRRIETYTKMMFTAEQGKIITSQFLQQETGWAIRIVMDNGAWTYGAGKTQTEAMADAKGRIIEKDYDHNEYEDYAVIQAREEEQRRHEELLEAERERHDEMMEVESERHEAAQVRHEEMLEAQREGDMVRLQELREQAERSRDDEDDEPEEESDGIGDDENDREQSPRILSIEARVIGSAKLYSDYSAFRLAPIGTRDSMWSDFYIAKVEFNNGEWSFGLGNSRQAAINEAQYYIKKGTPKQCYYDGDNGEFHQDL